MKKKSKLSLPAWILIALFAGIAVGIVCLFIDGGAGFTASYLKPLGTIFVNLLKFIVVPIVVLSMIEGIVSLGDIKRVGSIGWKALLYFFVTTAIACVIGLICASLFKAAGFFPSLKLAAGATWTGATTANFMDTIVGFFPSNLWTAFSSANMLQVIVISILLAGGMLAAGEKAEPCERLVSSLYSVFEQITMFIIRLSPIGVFAMMAWVVATQGLEILGSLALVILCVYVGYAVHAVLVYSLSAKVFGGISPVKFFKEAAPAMIFAFTSASSAATLPVSKECCDKLGSDNKITSFVLPLGCTVNMDGTAIYQCVATVFLASCCGIDLTLSQMLMVVVTATVASVGTAGVAGAGMIMLAMVLTAMGIPVDMIMIIYGVDRLFDMGRTTLNITGDIACTVCVSEWEKIKKK